ncbi:hypothetical protein [Paucibacter sp. Y2R2-4]|uniref:hypothetical protein n=1 Tax=Paucibacter sp. Y2R2-4 TaxID=2893553 RepID=UPI0021E42D38|nr:hypothetical protein [Paucibacter sp. Y2R2-4]MCV2349414.1 hypothetical protein [Paucibacter sp. Y2R2-4]
MTNKHGLQGLLWLACLISGPAAYAMPVLISSGQESSELSPLSASLSASANSHGHGHGHAHAHRVQPAAASHLSAKLQNLDEASSVAPMNELLGDVSKHSHATAAAAESVLGVGATQLRREQGSEHELMRSAVKELEIVADVKNVLQGVRAELHQVTGGHLASIQDDHSAELASLSRRIEEGQNKRYGDSSANDRPRSDAEIRADSMRASLLVSQLIDEITPWAIGAGVLLALFHATRAMLRLQAGRQLKAVRAAGESRRASSRSSSSSSSSNSLTDTAARIGVRRSERSGTHSGMRSSSNSSSRSSSRTGSRSRRKWI